MAYPNLRPPCSFPVSALQGCERERASRTVVNLWPRGNVITLGRSETVNAWAHYAMTQAPEKRRYCIVAIAEGIKTVRGSSRYRVGANTRELGEKRAPLLRGSTSRLQPTTAPLMPERR